MRLRVKNALLHKLGFVQPPYFYTSWRVPLSRDMTTFCVRAYTSKARGEEGEGEQQERLREREGSDPLS